MVGISGYRGEEYMGRSDLISEANRLLGGLQMGRIRSVAYDTAWGARPIGNGTTKARTEFPGALRWLLRNQMWDGSWGSEIEYIHDRLLSTIAAVNALCLNDSAKYRERIAMGIDYLWDNLDRLDEDPYETIGSELLLPTLLEEGKDLGLNVPDAPPSVQAKRERKLGLIPDAMIYSDQTTLAFSMEFLGDEVRPKDLEKCVNPNGSLGCSPSATMFLLKHNPDWRARNYLRWVSECMWSGGFPSQLPFETFEYAWTIYNFLKAGIKGLPGSKALLEQLDHFWRSRRNGVGWGNAFKCSDSDTSAITFKVLRDHGYHPDPHIFESYEMDKGFKCFMFEVNPSVSAHIHIIEALQDVSEGELPRKEEMLEKTIKFLAQKQVKGQIWTDKWHASPYYTTCHGIMALTKKAPELLEGPIDWLFETQMEDGGWGHYGKSTVEETAYAVQALMEYSTEIEPLDSEPLRRGSAFLQNHRYETLERLWIAKGLYAPVNVIKSAAIGALHSVSQAFEFDMAAKVEIEEMDVPTLNAHGTGGA
jgi:halimadienyl-diphosphate synthase